MSVLGESTRVEEETVDVSKAVEKLHARASHVLDLLIALEEKHAMLRPLAFDPELVERIGGGAAARGRVLLQNALLESCVQDLVKISLGTDKRAPSLLNIMTVLNDQSVRDRLLQHYTVVPPGAVIGDADPLPEDTWAQVVEGETQRLTLEFHETWNRLHRRWASVSQDARLADFKTWRDKLIAHSDLHHVDDEYRLIDLKDLKLKWGDLGELIQAMRPLVDDVNLMVRSASFSWDSLDGLAAAASTSFWAVAGGSEA